MNENENHKRTGIVIILDALGTKGLSKLEQWFERFEEIKKFLEDSFRSIDDYEKKGKSSRGRTVFEIFKEKKVMVMGDCIEILWGAKSEDMEKMVLQNNEFSKEQLELNLLYHGARLTSKIILKGLEKEILYRGTLSYDDYFIHSSKFCSTNNAEIPLEIVMGPAVDAAAELYDKAEWFGVTSSVETDMRISLLLETLRQRKNEDDDKWIDVFFKKYNVKLKDNQRLKLWSVAWPLRYLKVKIDNDQKRIDTWETYKSYVKSDNKSSVNSRARKEFLEKLSKMKIDLNTGSKYQNTLEYFDSFMQT